MVGAGRVVAGGLGRPRADEQRARVAQARDRRLERLDVDREVLGGVVVDEVDRGVERRGERDPAVVARARVEDVAARDAVASWRVDLALDRVGEGGVGRDEDRRRVGAVLGLGDEVGRDASRDRPAASARTIPSDGPAGRSMPTSPQTSILAAVTQALPGPTIRSTGARPASGRP